MRDFRPALRRALRQPCCWQLPRIEPNPFGSRQAFKRLITIYTEADHGPIPSARKLAARFHTCEKTIQRDITFLRRDFGLNLTYNKAAHQYEKLARASITIEEAA